MKYLPYYKKCMKEGVMDKPLLCAKFPSDKLLKLFYPAESSDIPYISNFYGYHFGPMRQTILLFMAAMNGEL